MGLEILAIVAGIAVLILSADKFVEGAAEVAAYLGMPPLLIGMVVVGFGTSAPEMLVSTLASLEGKPGLALGNAYGSNISNIGLILGICALIMPLKVESKVLKKEMPLLIFISILSGVLIYDGSLSRLDSVILLVLFFAIMGWSIFEGMKGSGQKDALSAEIEEEFGHSKRSLGMSFLLLLGGLLFLVASSRILVWGAVGVATRLGVSELIIGLTIVAVGTSLPELASSIVAVKKGEDDIALGNVLGSNLFNTLAVVGLAGSISPFQVEPLVFSRDIMAVNAFTIALFIMCMKWGGVQRIARFSGVILLLGYAGYNYWLLG